MLRVQSLLQPLKRQSPKVAKTPLCGARNWFDEFWKVHRCGLPRGHTGKHICYAIYQFSPERRDKVRVPCGFSWQVPEEVFELYRENS